MFSVLQGGLSNRWGTYCYVVMLTQTLVAVEVLDFSLMEERRPRREWVLSTREGQRAVNMNGVAPPPLEPPSRGQGSPDSFRGSHELAVQSLDRRWKRQDNHTHWCTEFTYCLRVHTLHDRKYSQFHCTACINMPQLTAHTFASSFKITWGLWTGDGPSTETACKTDF